MPAEDPPKQDQAADFQIGPAIRSMCGKETKESRLGKLASVSLRHRLLYEVLAGKADHGVMTDISPGIFALAKEWRLLT
jgi:hypothetical protein